MVDTLVESYSKTTHPSSLHIYYECFNLQYSTININLIHFVKTNKKFHTKTASFWPLIHFKYEFNIEKIFLKIHIGITIWTVWTNNVATSAIDEWVYEDTGVRIMLTERLSYKGRFYAATCASLFSWFLLWMITPKATLGGRIGSYYWRKQYGCNILSRK